MGVGFKGLMNPLEHKFTYAQAKVTPRSENSRPTFFVEFR